ncbi:hypothetical protein RCO24_14020 [Hyphomicrobium sp. LHD-15]|nr:hypothetical protein [Hyphomicrobium sp. LHD-15]MDQ8699852.1 hypothetical protein [Hyphomicrobium sp. LHD-15]
MYRGTELGLIEGSRGNAIDIQTPTPRHPDIYVDRIVPWNIFEELSCTAIADQLSDGAVRNSHIPDEMAIISQFEYRPIRELFTSWPAIEMHIVPSFRQVRETIANQRDRGLIEFRVIFEHECVRQVTRDNLLPDQHMACVAAHFAILQSGWRKEPVKIPREIPAVNAGNSLCLHPACSEILFDPFSTGQVDIAIDVKYSWPAGYRTHIAPHDKACWAFGSAGMRSQIPKDALLLPGCGISLLAEVGANSSRGGARLFDEAKPFQRFCELRHAPAPVHARVQLGDDGAQRIERFRRRQKIELSPFDVEGQDARLVGAQQLRKIKSRRFHDAIERRIARLHGAHPKISSAVERHRATGYVAQHDAVEDRDVSRIVALVNLRNVRNQIRVCLYADDLSGRRLFPQIGRNKTKSGAELHNRLARLDDGCRYFGFLLLVGAFAQDELNFWRHDASVDRQPDTGNFGFSTPRVSERPNSLDKRLHIFRYPDVIFEVERSANSLLIAQ